MTVLFGVVLPLILILGSLVVTVGSWYTHGRHLQTKADAGALAGGGSWGFPCAPDVDAEIEDNARKYVGNHTKADGNPYPDPATPTATYNPQVGGVAGDQIHVVLNGPGWYDGDTNPNPLEMTDPNGSVCEAKYLDVKATEQDSPLLWGWLPFYPDIKKKARIEIQEAEGVSGLLPVGVRVPKPVSSAAVFYNEVNGNILSVRYFSDNSGIFGLPAGLEGLSTLDSAAGNWASINVGGAPPPAANTRIGVAIALSFRRACNTTTPPLPAGMKTGSAPCFEDAGFTNINGPNGFCNQGTNTAIVDCFYATGDWPSQTVQSGLHFIRGYPTGNAGTGPPELRSAYLEDVPSSCIGTAYFNSEPVNQCQARLHVKIDIGEMIEDVPPGGPNTPTNTRVANNVEVRYKQVEADGTVVCDFGPNCSLQTAGSTGSLVTFSTQGSPSSPHLRMDARSLGNAVAIEVRMKDSSVVPNDKDCGPGKSFSDRCRWFYTGNRNFGPDTPPNDTDILSAPVQRSFTGYLDEVGPVRWLRLTADKSCNGIGGGPPPPAPADDFVGLEAASQPAGTRCFYLEMGLKGGVSKDQDEVAFAFNEGTRSSQMGSVNCDPDIGQGQMLTEGVVNGCKPWFGPNGFDTNPLCPSAQALFDLPNPGGLFSDWPPIECLERRPTGSMNQLRAGLDERILGSTGQCPADVPRLNPDGTVNPSFKWGRNYWHRNNNLYDLQNFANLDGSPPTGNKLNMADPRLVTLFLMPYDAFADKTKFKVYPIVGLGAFYITGWGRWQGNKFQGDPPANKAAPDDPCTDGNVGDPLDGLPFGQGNEPPPDLRACGGNCSGTVVWGHFIKGVKLSGSATPSGVLCEPQGSLQVCVPALVE